MLQRVSVRWRCLTIVLIRLTLSGHNKELIVFSARNMRSDLRHRLANLIHMTGSSSGDSTRARTCRMRCHTSTSG